MSMTQHLRRVQVLDIDEALAVAEGEGQDLVEVSPLANPPVCRLQDYNKAKYAAKLREKVRGPSCGSPPLGRPAQPPCRHTRHIRWFGL